MIIPEHGDYIQYQICSRSIYIDVLYNNSYFYVSTDSLCTLYNESQLVIEYAIRKYHKKYTKKKIVDDNEIIGPDVLHGMPIVRFIGKLIQSNETSRFVSWAENRLTKYKIQKEKGEIQYIHSIKSYWMLEDYWDIYNEDDVDLDLMIRYLQLISKTFTQYLDKLISIEKANEIKLSDVEYLDQIELYYIPRNLQESVISEMGGDIIPNVYLATLQDITERLKKYLNIDDITDTSRKIMEWKINTLRWNIAPKQMHYIIECFEFFSSQLINDYNQNTDFEYSGDSYGEYSFSRLNKEAAMFSDLDIRRKIFVDARIRATKELIKMQEGNNMRDHCQQFINKCQQAIELTEYEQSQLRPSNLNEVQANSVEMKQKGAAIKPAPKKKTDIIKILSAMYDARMFADAEGKPLTNKQKMMEAFGEFLGDDFSSYSTSLSQAKIRDRKTFMKPFTEIEKAAERYLEE